MPPPVPPAGFAPVAPPSAKPIYKAAGNALYDPFTGDCRLDENGNVVPIHWVDQAVAIALGFRNGTFAPDVSVGQKYREIVRAGGDSLIATATDMTRQALSQLLQNQDISIKAITVSTPARGQVLIVTEYYNLRNVPVTKQTIQTVIL